MKKVISIFTIYQFQYPIWNRNKAALAINPVKWAFLLLLAFNFSLCTLHSFAQGVTRYGENAATSTNFVDWNGKIGNSLVLNKNGKVFVVASIAPATVAPLCYNTAPGTFTATGTGGTGSYTYLWYKNGSSTGTTTQTYAPGTLTTSSTFYCAITSGSYGTTNTSTTSITVYGNLTAGISPGNTSIPYNTSPGAFTATGGGGSGAYTYLWYLNGASTGITAQTYDPGNMVASYTVYCAVTSGVCGTLNTSTTTITVNAPVWNCGSALPITHTAGIDGAPETKTVSYGTVQSSISGASKCWITQNLGSSRQGTDTNDNTDASAGWYWQFNRKQGYASNSGVTSPAWTITTITENSDWLPANDPCTLELGTGWRIPTNTEWNTVYSGGVNQIAAGFYSVLKLHAGGSLKESGTLTVRGTDANFWSSTSQSDIYGKRILLYGGNGGMWYSPKAVGFTLRCLKD